MNKNVIFAGLIGFIAGGLTAGFVSYNVTKRKYEKILEESRKATIISKIRTDIIDDIPEKYKRKSVDNIVEEPKNFNEDEKKAIKEKLKYNNEKTTEYAKMYKGSAKDILESEDDNDETNIFDAAAEENGIDNSDPIIITEERYDEFASYPTDEWECVDLFLYSNGTITNDEDIVIDDSEFGVMFGSCLETSNFKESNEKHIYIQCFSLSTVYHIQKFDKEFIKEEY